MRRNTMLFRVIEALVNQGAPTMNLSDAKKVVRPMVQSDRQMTAVLYRLKRHGYIRQIVFVTNRARRNCGRAEIL